MRAYPTPEMFPSVAPKLTFGLVSEQSRGTFVRVTSRTLLFSTARAKRDLHWVRFFVKRSRYGAITFLSSSTSLATSGSEGAPAISHINSTHL